MSSNTENRIFHHIQKFKTQRYVDCELTLMNLISLTILLSPELSIKVFQQLLIKKVIPSNSKTCIEQYFVSFLWAITNPSPNVPNDLNIIANIASKLTEYRSDPLSEEATHASLVVSRAQLI